MDADNSVILMLLTTLLFKAKSNLAEKKLMLRWKHDLRGLKHQGVKIIWSHMH